VLELLQNHWPVVALVVLVALLLVWWLFGRSKPVRERHRAPDALDEGAAPAQRNQALIDAPSAVTAASLADTGPPIMAGIGEAIAAGAAQEVSAQEPAPAAPPPPAEPAGDDLSRIKGVGPKLVALLGQIGVTSYAEIAGWNDADIDRIDAQLGTFAGRIRRDNWVEQCRYLATGDTAGFEGQFGKL